MTAPRELDTFLTAWMADVAGEPATEEQVGRLTATIRQRQPRPAWLARIHDRWAHGAGAMARQGARVGLLVIAALMMLLLAGLAVQLAPGGSRDQNGPGPVVPSPAMPTGTPPATLKALATTSPPEVGSLCRAGAPATLPAGPLPVATRPADMPANNGYLAIEGIGQPELLDPSTGASAGLVAVSSSGQGLQVDVLPGAWSPDGRWLALRWGNGTACGEELIVSSDGTRAVDVTDYPSGRDTRGAVWSPDGRWLAVDTGDRVDVFGIASDGAVSGARTVWQAAAGSGMALLGGAVGPAWGRDGTLAFQIEDPNGKEGSGTTVAFFAPGASSPRLVHVSADVLAPLAWTTDSSAVVAVGDVGLTDVGMFRISPFGSARIPLAGLHLHGGKWLDVPLAIVGEHIVFDAYTDASGSDNETMYTGFNNDVYRCTANPPMRDQPGNNNTMIFGSHHRGGVCMAYCDGSVHVVPYGVDPAIHKVMGRRMD